MSKGTWDKPDYKPDPEVDKEAIGLRARLETEGYMTEWPIRDYPVRPGYDRDSIQAYCVRNKKWQDFRLSLKGLDTHEKLAKLKEWWDSSAAAGTDINIVKVQVGNYLGALRRGGQLDDKNRVRRVR